LAAAHEATEKLARLNIRVVDLDRFAALLPSEVTDPYLLDVKKRVADYYVEELFSPQQLADISNFLASEGGEAVLSANRAILHSRGTSDADRRGTISPTIIVAVPPTELLNVLSPNDLAKFDVFYRSPTGTFLKSEVLRIEWGLGAALLGAMLSLQDVDLDIQKSYMAEVLETEGVAIFPNRVLRRSIIEDFRSVDE
jgi:hypothetical protein